MNNDLDVMQTKSSVGYIVVDDKDCDVIYYHYRDNSTTSDVQSVESSHLLLESHSSCNAISNSYSKRFSWALVLRIFFSFCLLSFVTIVCDKYIFRINICKQLYETVCNGFTINTDITIEEEDNNLLVISSYESAVTVQTDCIKIIGSIEENVFAFKGIPYALPPTGTRRWSRPQSLSRDRNSCNYSVNPFRAHHFSALCLQYNSTINQIIGKEDCLYLNVWTPIIDDQANLNVLVYIHGGLENGSSHRHFRPSGQLARQMNAVFVSINYRLNAMGFLALDLLANANANSSHANYGLWDITEALQWVSHNIKLFGGNPHRITLFGSDGQLITSLLSNSLFRALIRNVWIVGYNRMKIKHKFSVQSQYFRNCFLTQTNCSTVSCLQSIDANNILDIYQQNCIQDNNVSLVVYDDEILSENTIDDEISQTPVLLINTDISDCQPNDRLSNHLSQVFSYFVENSRLSDHPMSGLLDRNQMVLNTMFVAIDQNVETISQQNTTLFGDQLLNFVINFLNDRYNSMQLFNASIISCQNISQT